MDQFLDRINQATKPTIKVSVNSAALKDVSKECGFVGSIDQGTSSTRFMVFSKKGRVVASAQMEHTQIFPPGEDKVGWHEHDPLEIWANTVACIDAVSKALKNKATLNMTQTYPIKAVGVTNQRETTIAWNAETGKPYYNAIVWDDVRTTHTAHEIACGNVNRLRAKTGLPLASYFAGTKVKWLLDNVDELRNDIADPEKKDQVRFGTVDTW